MKALILLLALTALGCSTEARDACNRRCASLGHYATWTTCGKRSCYTYAASGVLDERSHCHCLTDPEPYEVSR